MCILSCLNLLFIVWLCVCVPAIERANAALLSSRKQFPNRLVGKQLRIFFSYLFIFCILFRSHTRTHSEWSRHFVGASFSLASCGCIQHAVHGRNVSVCVRLVHSSSIYFVLNVSVALLLSHTHSTLISIYTLSLSLMFCICCTVCV